ncbi:MAG: hypothetical protein H7246_04680 [Phycisphaerae bacterium]|nr:hypothetical protein [Saprospiraceae bacterium]
MRKLSFITCTLMLFFSLQISLSAQTTATWQGGKPGKVADWSCAANWKEGRMPDAFSLVLIPSGRAFYPVIRGKVPPIDALLVESGALLTLQKNSSLCILGETGRLGGIILLGEIRNSGRLEFGNLPEWNIAQLQHIQGAGAVLSSR